jgi:cytochrome d ubiquinol oxidase subunit II
MLNLYTPLLLLLFALILRDVSFEFRNKVDSDAWRRVWDTTLVLGSFLPALLLGVAFANLFAGVPVDAEGRFHGNLFTLLNPSGLLGGVLVVLVFAVHGALWLAIKSEGELQQHAGRLAGMLWWPLAVVAVAFLGATWFATGLWQNVLAKPYLLPLLEVAGLFGTVILHRQGRWWPAWFASSATILGTVFFGVAGLFPALLKSSLDPADSATAFNSASSQLTLQIMFGVVVCFLPIVIGYQIWVYRTFRGPVTQSDLDHGPAY